MKTEKEKKGKKELKGTLCVKNDNIVGVNQVKLSQFS